MGRREHKALIREQHAFVKGFSAALEPLPPERFPQQEARPEKAWLSRYYLVQLFQGHSDVYPPLMRLSVCRTKIQADGRWEDGLTWDELQAIKREVGYGDWYAIEVFPPDKNIVNVANMRHLWLLPTPLPIGWF